uniref:Leucine-rich repeat protein n=1 Tax=Tanacetum cinerariifolium TaxID=118510 RepID=A0A699I9C3_TANCI|nr:leucine-rich repeat protein [Tanacetum cinerariifolium]
MIVYLKNMAGYKMAHFKGMTFDQVRPIFEREYNKVQTFLKPDKDEEPTKKRVFELKVKALHVKYPLIDWEIRYEGSRSYWKIIRVGGITQAYQSFEDTLKDFDREDLDALWRLVKERFSTTTPTVDKKKHYSGVHQVSSTTRRHDMYMLAEKDYPLPNGVMILMLSTKLQVEEDSEMAKDLVMNIFMKANQSKSKSLDTSSK